MTPDDAASLATMGPLLAGVAGTPTTTERPVLWCEECDLHPCMRGFLVCEQCWAERGVNEQPLMSWEMGT